MPEHLASGFLGRHPRTMFGIDRAGFAWLVTVDGRQPDTSAGMTLVELQRLAKRIGLTDALNLDGGGSTTMVIAGNVVNHPSDPTGAAHGQRRSAGASAPGRAGRRGALR